MLAILALGALTMQEPSLDAMLKQVDPKRLRATVEKLASFNTRNTNTPELFQAAEWIAGEYKKIPGLQVELYKYQVKRGSRIPADKEVVEVVAVLPGRTNRRILVGGHFDTINMGQGADPFTARSPGANDDGSGTALALELARILSQRKWENTLVFCAFSGEEQGLLGSGALAKRAREENWDLEAVLSNDMVGNTHNDLSQKETKFVRVFSEEYVPSPSTRTRGADSQPAGVSQSTSPPVGEVGKRSEPGEGVAAPPAAQQGEGPRPHNSRELARFIEWQVRQTMKGRHGIKLVFRRDRFGRGGDHTPFVRQGFTAVRFVEVIEEYNRQHTVNDLPEFIDYAYFANNVRANLCSMAALANAGEAPTNVRMVRDQGHHSKITWRGTPGVKYVVYWRETSSPVWQGVFEVGEKTEFIAQKINVDDHMFAVGAVGGVPVAAQ
ncbi:MAG: M20/M25/M40 family metallo-hydrolase [Armatimonadetes bacterium]|nr:M20/M25/M40 family metallo-hydrolase [Armatimonadota bacterium]